ncbi:UNVERIFIED_CONTAM: Phytochrome A, partial [Sesamum radiatum]
MHPRSSFQAFLEVFKRWGLPCKDYEMDELEAVTSEMVRLIKIASVLILVVDAVGLVNRWNTKIVDLTGVPIDEVVGRHLLSLVEDSLVDK